MATRRQHYVWRHYLEGWHAHDMLVTSLVGDKLVRTKPRKIMVERDFYRLRAITPADAAVLRKLLMRKETPSALRRSHEKLIAQFQYLSDVHSVVQRNPRFSSADKAIVQDAAINFEDRIHGGIEHDAVPILRALRNKDPSVIHSDATAFSFYNFMSQQYFRTKSMRNAIQKVLNEIMPPDTAKRIRHVYCHCIATNLGASLYSDREKFELLYLQCPPEQTLITGDQPVVNILDTHDGTPPQDIALYYPLSPTLGMFLAPKALAMAATVADRSASEIDQLNDLIACKSERFLVANSDNPLLPYMSKSRVQPPSPLSIVRS